MIYKCKEEKIFYIKEIKEVFCSKRLMISLLLSAFFCLIMNVVANMPGSVPMFDMDVSRALLSSILLIPALCSDVVYIIMIDEINYGTFDIILLSKCKTSKIIVLKIFIPFFLSLLLIGLNIGLNYIATFFFSNLTLIFPDIIFFLYGVCSACGCCIVEFLRCLKSNKFTPSNNNIFVFIFGLLYALLYYFTNIINWGISIFIIFGMTVFIYYLCFLTIKNRTNNRNRINNKKITNINLNFIRDNNWLKSIISRELRKIYDYKIIIIKIIYYLFFVFLIGKQNNLYLNILFFIIISILSFTTIIDVYMNSIKIEIIENAHEVLEVAGISRKKNYLSILLTDLFFGLLVGLIYIFILFTSKINNIFIYIFQYFFFCIVGGLISYYNVIKKCFNLKDCKLVKKSIIIYYLILNLFFYLFVLKN